MDKEQLFQTAKEIGLKVEKDKKIFLEEDTCLCGESIDFIETEEEAEVVLGHMISYYIKGVRDMDMAKKPEPETEEEPAYIG